MDSKTLTALAVAFAPLSIVSIGGGASVFAELQRQAVDVHSWVTQGEFAALFAISRAAPGPGALLDDVDRMASGRMVRCVARVVRVLSAVVRVCLCGGLLLESLARLCVACRRGKCICPDSRRPGSG